MLVINRFTTGGWATLLIIALICGVCIYIRAHYDDTRVLLSRIDAIFASQPFGSASSDPTLDPNAPTAVFVVDSSRGGGIHTLQNPM